VDSLPEDEAIRLFRKLHPAPDPRGENVVTDEAIKSLLSKLFYHTLLIELVAKAGASTGIPFADLQTMIGTQFIHHQSLNETPIPTGKHGSVVATNLKKAKIEDYIWLIFSQVKGLDERSKHLLKAMALLPVATPFDLEFLKAHFAFFNISDAIVHLDALIERGWLQKEQAEGQKPYFKMHPLIGDVVVEHLGVDVGFAETYIKSVAYHMYYQNTNSETNIFELKKKKPLAEHLRKLFFYANTEGVSELFRSLSSIDLQFGFYHKAVEYGERALQIAEDIFDENHPFISECQNDLAIVYSNLGQYKRGADLLEKALKSDLTNFADDHPTVAVRQSNLGDAYRNLGEYERASNFLKIALENELKNFGQEHPTVAASQSSLALLYHQLGNHVEAAVLLESALESDEKNFGSEHPKVAIRQGNLGDVYRHLFRFDKATELLETALASDLKNFGEEHPNIAFRQHNLALVYIYIEREEEAKALWQAAYQNFLKNFGAEHPHTIKLKEFAEM
jgi:tetratricopeptide (TPR) repeat protein